MARRLQWCSGMKTPTRIHNINTQISNLEESLRTVWNNSAQHQRAADLLAKAGEAVIDRDLTRAEALFNEGFALVQAKSYASALRK